VRTFIRPRHICIHRTLLAKGVPEADGIPCVLPDQYLWDPILGSGCGPVVGGAVRKTQIETVEILETSSITLRERPSVKN
jgi:hypothetical protein